eukprot:7386569-Prymnesium_polylepis.1
MGSGTGARNDQIFNIGIQGLVQLNNGFEDDSGRGINNLHQEPDPASTIKNLIAGPFYQNYPLQMFDRKVKPLSEMFIGLVEKTIVEEDLKQLMEQHPHMLNDTPWRKETVGRVTVFQFVPFSSRQAYQFATTHDEGGNKIPDNAIVDAASMSEVAALRRGPLNHNKRSRDGSYRPHLEWKYPLHNINYLGINQEELCHMVGAWRLGKVLDVASQRKEGHTCGPIDTAFRVTLN